MYEKLSVFVGDWVANPGDKDVERCEWFEGQKHIICTWAAEIEGKHYSGESIISYSTILEKYTYYGFNSLGRNSYQTGDHKDNKFVFFGQMKKDDVVFNTRTTLIFSPDGYEMKFIVDKDENGNWINIETKTVYKLKEKK